MKKILILVFAMLMSLNVGCGQKNESIKKTNDTAQEQETAQTSKPESQSEKITLSNITMKYHDGITEVLGESKNNDSKKHTFGITVTFYDSNKKILGTAMGSINDLEAGTTKTFEADATEDYSKAASNKVEISIVE